MTGGKEKKKKTNSGGRIGNARGRKARGQRTGRKKKTIDRDGSTSSEGRAGGANVGDQRTRAGVPEEVATGAGGPRAGGLRAS